MKKLHENKNKTNIIVTLLCSVCINKGLCVYYVVKNRKANKKKLSLRKFCKICNQHTNFKEK